MKTLEFECCSLLLSVWVAIATTVTGQQSICVQGEIRLSDGASPFQGRVEICLNGQWGTVCDDSWDDRDTMVVCRQIGIQLGQEVNITASINRNNLFNIGGEYLPILLDDVACNGSEDALLDCRYNRIENCQHYEDTGVTCIPNDPSLVPVNASVVVRSRAAERFRERNRYNRNVSVGVSVGVSLGIAAVWLVIFLVCMISQSCPLRRLYSQKPVPVGTNRSTTMADDSRPILSSDGGTLTRSVATDNQN